MPRILGIDPGLTRCGVGLIDLAASRKVTLLEVDVFRSAPGLALEQRIGLIGESLENLIIRVKPDAIALERVYADVNVRSVMGTAQISGVALFLARKHGIPIHLHTPTEVKAAVTGSGRAGKAQVGNMVAKILGLAEAPKPADAADSLAIAICHAWRSSGAALPDNATLTEAQQKWHAAVRAAAAKQEG
ncbi:MAG: crossover junction endodeoxyribonuclease RuvC [Micrococcales bacterium]